MSLPDSNPAFPSGARSVRRTVPAGAATFFAFARLLRHFGFPVATEQTISFMDAIALLGPRDMTDIREAALATLAPRPDRRAEFDALFRTHFFGTAEVTAPSDDEDETAVRDGGQHREHEAETKEAEGGELASTREQFSARRFAAGDALTLFGRRLKSALPRRRAFRMVRTRSGGTLDLRRSLSAIVRSDGDVPRPVLRRRRDLPRKILMLLDVSGSMKQHTTDHLRIAHAVVQGAGQAEIFTFGTRLTRITSALKARDPALALSCAAAEVDDWDGGTRIGPALLAFLSVPRDAAFARGAAIVILSDGLERGGHAEMEVAIRRLSARAFRLSLCTPLAGDPRFRPRTAALLAILPHLDDLVDGSSAVAVADFILSLARPAPAASTIWRSIE